MDSLPGGAPVAPSRIDTLGPPNVAPFLSKWDCELSMRVRAGRFYDFTAGSNRGLPAMERDENSNAFGHRSLSRIGRLCFGLGHFTWPSGLYVYEENVSDVMR